MRGSEPVSPGTSSDAASIGGSGDPESVPADWHVQLSSSQTRPAVQLSIAASTPPRQQARPATPQPPVGRQSDGQLHTFSPGSHIAFGQPGIGSHIPPVRTYPGLQTKSHVPIKHRGDAFGGAVQAFPHAPQLPRSPSVCVSQPSAGLLLQLPKPGAHPASEHVPPAHAGNPLGYRHALRHVPQFDTSLLVEASHPLASMRSQLPQPGAHEATLHVDMAHVAVAFGNEQRFMHVAQFAGSDARATSHPFAGAVSQSPKPGSQRATVHTDAVQAAVALASAQRSPHAPQ